MCPRAASYSVEQRRADPVATGCQGKCPHRRRSVRAHGGFFHPCSSAGVSFPAARALSVSPAGDVTRGSATLAVADPNFEGRSVAVGDPLEGRAVCACAQALCCRRLRAWGAPWGRPSFGPFFFARARLPHAGPGASTRRRRRSSASGTLPHARRRVFALWASPPLREAFPPRGPCNLSPNGHDHRHHGVVVCGRPVGLPYRFAYASRPHSGAALSSPKSTLVSFQASYRGPQSPGFRLSCSRVIHRRRCARLCRVWGIARELSCTRRLPPTPVDRLIRRPSRPPGKDVLVSAVPSVQPLVGAAAGSR